MSLSLRPWTPPCSLTCCAYASDASGMVPQVAAGPESGPVRPMVISVSVTPGTPGAARAEVTPTKQDASVSAMKRIFMSEPRAGGRGGEPIARTRTGRKEYSARAGDDHVALRNWGRSNQTLGSEEAVAFTGSRSDCPGGATILASHWS